MPTILITVSGISFRRDTGVYTVTFESAGNTGAATLARPMSVNTKTKPTLAVGDSITVSMTDTAPSA